jgi:HEAT repeat protein
MATLGTLTGIVWVLFGATLVFSGYALVLRVGNERRDRLWKVLAGDWEQAVLDSILDPDAIPIAQARVAPEYGLQFVQFVLDYSRRVRGEELRTLCRLAAPFLDEIAERAGHRRAVVRARAVQTLGTLGLPEYADVVLRALEDDDALVSMVAARSLAKAELPQFAAAVLGHLDRFDGWDRRFLASMLASMGRPAAEELRLGLADPERPLWLRTVFSDALHLQLDAESADIAAVALADATDRDFVSSLLTVLSVVGRPEHLDVVRPLSRSDDFAVRAHALSAIGLLGGQDEIPGLLENMGDVSPWVALHAARGAREAGGRAELLRIEASGGPLAPVAGQVLYEEAEDR